MKTLGEFIKAILIGGLLGVLPIGLMAMIVLKILAMLMPVEKPIDGNQCCDITSIVQHSPSR